MNFLIAILILSVLVKAFDDYSVSSVESDPVISDRPVKLQPANGSIESEEELSIEPNPEPKPSEQPAGSPTKTSLSVLDLKFRRAQSIRRLRKPFAARRERKMEYFLSTTPFVYGDTVFGLGRTTSGILYIYFTVMYAVYVLCTTVLLFDKRRDPSLSKFPLWLSHFLPAGMNVLIVALGFIRHMFRAKYPCFIVLWTYGLLAPMYVIMILQGRSLNLIFEYHWNKRMQALLQATDRSSAEDVILLPRTRELDAQQVRYSKDWLWIKKYGMTTTIVGLFAVQFIMTLCIQLFSPHYRIWPKMIRYRCVGMWESILPMVSLLMYMFVIPLYLFIQLKRINDSCGVRQDIYAAVTQSAWIAVLFTILRHVYFIGKFVGYLPTGFAIMSTFGILHYHTVCAPLLRVYQWQWSRSRVKKRMRKFYILKRRIESWLFPRALRIRIPKTAAVIEQQQDGAIHVPQPIKAPALVDKVRPRNRNLLLPGTQHPSQADSIRAGSAASPAVSHLSPDLKPPTFQQVLQDEALCELFERYTLLEFSRENLLFYRAVCALRTTYAALPMAAAQIFLKEKSRNLAAQFISQNAPAEVNIPGPVRKRIETRLAEMDIDLTLFDEAQREVFRLMQSWSYPRFLRTLPEAEIRRFNRKAARRNSVTEANVPTAVAMPSLPTIPSPDFNFSTSMTSFTMPWDIAQVSLSSSP